MSVKGDLYCSFPTRYYSFRVALDYLLFKILQIYLAVCFGAAFLLIHWLKQAILAPFSLSQLSSEPQLYVWDGHIKDIFDNLPSQE